MINKGLDCFDGFQADRRVIQAIRQLPDGCPVHPTDVVNGNDGGLLL
ncbi:hypothetical protein [Halocynthiibacter namhaensis]|nr:hypothetical protein [Halocynthiibacter namhaensis]